MSPPTLPYKRAHIGRKYRGYRGQTHKGGDRLKTEGHTRGLHMGGDGYTRGLHTVAIETKGGCTNRGEVTDIQRTCN